MPRMVPLLSIILRVWNACAAVGLLVVAFLRGCAGALISQRSGHDDHRDLLPSLSTSEDRGPFPPFDEWGRLDSDGSSFLHEEKFFPENVGSFAEAEDFEFWALRRRQGRGALLPLVSLRRPSRHVALRASLILLAFISAAFVVFLCARHIARLGRSGPRFLAGSEPSGACGGMETSSDFFELDANLKKKVSQVLNLIKKLADTCGTVLQDVPIQFRIRGNQEMLASTIEELAALAVVLGENMKNERNRVAGRVLAVAQGLILTDSISQTSTAMRVNLNRLKNLLKKVKDDGPGPAEMPHEERLRLLQELLQLQVVGLELQIAAVEGLIPRGAEGGVPLTLEQLRSKMNAWGDVAMTRRIQTFSIPSLSAWLGENQVKRKGHGLLLKVSTVEELKQGGPPPPLRERIEKLYASATRRRSGGLAHFQPKGGPPLEEAAAGPEGRQPSDSQHEDVSSVVSDGSGQAVLQAGTSFLDPPRAPSDPSAAYRQQSDPPSSSLRRQTLEPSGPLIGLPFPLLSVLRPPHAPSSSSADVSSEHALFLVDTSQQPAVGFDTESASLHHVSASPLHSPRAPKAPGGSQPPFRGHALGEPSQSWTEEPDPHLHSHFP